MIKKLQLDIPILLPDVLDEADACISRLVDDLQGKSGIDRVHVRPAGEGASAQLCIHYDPNLQPLARIRELAEAAGARISQQFGHMHLEVEGIQHERRARTVAETLRKMRGVLEAQASAAGTMQIEFDRDQVDESALLAVLSRIGVTPKHQEQPSGSPEHGHDGEKKHAHDHGGIFGPNSELFFALSCGAALAIGFTVEKLTSAPGWLPLVCYIAAYVFGGFYTVREAFDNLRLRRFEIDTLMLVAAAGAAALGSWAEGALLLFLFSLGHALEHYAMGRAKRAIEALAELAPETARVRREGEWVEVPVSELDIGNVVSVRPNERLPADGFVVAGTSSVNQAPVTGESIPVDKRPVGDLVAARNKASSVDASSRVFAGTINGSGALEVEVTKRSGESALARVVQLVSEAETRQSPTQRLTERIERIFVPSVLALAFVLLFAWVVVDEPFRDSFYRAMAVLVAASPCALAIATPSAVLSGIARAARGGVLVKGGAPLEDLGSLRAMAFDKTGTLTEGRPRITDVVPAEGIDEAELLDVAVAVESLSDHPLAAAIARDGRGRLDGREPALANDLKSLTGQGVTARIGDTQVWIGKAEMFGSDGLPPLSPAVAAAIETLREQGRTTMVVRLGERDLGAIGLMDTPRADAREALEHLRTLGIERMIMISGDHRNVANAVAEQVGLDEAWGDLMPEDKVEAIRKLREQDKVAMVGDGVNDAPAMANATVGIAMGAAGSDVALETADVALMADDLRNLPFAVGLSRRTRAVIRQNLFVSLGVVALLVPATIFGLGIGPAVAMHEGSTLLVVINALRLLAYQGAPPSRLRPLSSADSESSNV
ncbi:heavy metal translocating P-type ATPase [Pseudoxanthomonas winnipegensis]|uniref:P-type Zn(2+) transporter n=1 Tax=Pseudoxanthomonas winnipegensis TaxID=2480810 RepID=A0A4Q8LCS7_9GAMM|nr:heavy metal translocating P-type ATPase [Pseudoxanthomonas winnipegensis]TAA26688.1 heavy metal translocating P-type ATPase [Pseudoxanthomonas winnipegensis]TAA39151.1 heavy metal translocating P-type ATPase [Pseudoxanthomonas winnipegensis]